MKTGAIDTFRPKNDPHDFQKTLLNVAKGAFRFTTTLAGRKRDIRTQIRSATIGIRGTDVWGKAEDARDFVVLLEGKIDIERGGQTYAMATPLTLFMAPRGQAALPIGPVDPDDLARWAQETEPQAAAGARDIDGGFRVNLASLPDPAAAEDLVNRLAAAGYAANSESASSGGRTVSRVYIDGYASEADAQTSVATLRAAFGLTSPWISRGSP